MIKWLQRVSMILASVLVIVLSGLSDLQRALGAEPPDGPGYVIKASESDNSGLLESDQDQGKDIVVDNKDLERLYKELLSKKKEEEGATVLKAGKESIYQVVLLNGRTLEAVTVRLNKTTVIITDYRGMTINLDRNGISRIDKIAREGRSGN